MRRLLVLGLCLVLPTGCQPLDSDSDSGGCSIATGIGTLRMNAGSALTFGVAGSASQKHELVVSDTAGPEGTCTLEGLRTTVLQSEERFGVGPTIWCFLR